MKPEYDFNKGERGKFFRPNAELRLPIYLNADIQVYVAERAARNSMANPAHRGKCAKSRRRFQ
jgi:hypothetical protein